MRDAVLGRGDTWLDRAFVVNDWYVSGYEPLRDATGSRIGMLYVGYLGHVTDRQRDLAVIVGIFLLVMVLAALFSLRWAGSIFRPLESMNRTIAQVEGGDTGARVGPVQARDEVGALANHLDQLLDVIDDETPAHCNAGPMNSTPRWSNARTNWPPATAPCSKPSASW